MTGRCGSQLAGKYADSYTSPQYSDCLELHPHDPSADAILNNMRRLSEIWRNRSFGYELAIKAIAVEIWLQTVLMLHSRSRSTLSLPQNADQIRIRQIVTYIHLYFRAKLTLADLAGCVNISTGECCRLFARTVGDTPIGFLNRYRISQAQLMLRDTHASILQIAQDTGFPSINHFITMFKRYSGCTPRQYRLRIQQAAEDPAQSDMAKVTHT